MPDEVLEFGEWLRRKRGGLGLTQAEFAQRVGCAPITLRKFETGERRPSHEMALRLAACLNLPEAQHSLVARFARGDADAHAQLAAVAHAAPDRAASLPFAPYNMIGRAGLLAEALALLQKPGMRVLNLIGPPGVGKTRLATELGRQSAQAFVNGAAFVELARIEQPDLVASAVAGALRLQAGKTAADDAVVTHLRNRRLLLILDNFEHLLHADDESAAARFVARVAAHCPGVVCLVTSRERLRVRAEQVLLVPPLALVPEPGLPDSVNASAAAGMFIDRAVAVLPAFRLSPANAPIVAALCAHVDGLPLAIELLAARIDEASPEQLLAELRAGLPVNGGLADLPARHQSVDKAIDWTMSRLSPASCALLAGLGVFVGGFDEAAAQAVCPHRPDDLLALRRAHLVMADGDRLRLLEPIRQYAQRRLGDDAPAVALRHAAYFGALAQRARTGLISPQQAAWQVTLDAEHANLQSALRWSLAHGRPAHALEVGQGIWRFWHQRGFVREGLHWLQAALALDDAAPAEHRANPSLKAFSLRAAGILSWALCNYPQADAHMRASLLMGRGLGDVENISGALTGLGMINGDWGRYDDAMRWLDESIAYSRANSPANLKFPVQIKSGLLQRLGLLPEAHALYTESLALNEALGDIEGITGALHGLADVAISSGALDEAESQIARARDMSAGIKHRRRLAWSAFLQGRLLYARGELAGAQAQLRHALAEHRAIDDTASILEVLRVLAGVHLAMHSALEAAALLGAAEAGLAALGTGLTQHQQAQIALLVAECRAQLGPARCDLALAQGALNWPDELDVAPPESPEPVVK